MSHHYGRHGPRAWLRRHKRRYRSSRLPVPARPVVADLTLTDPGVTIVRVHLPANVERVIFIMIGNPNNDNEENRQELPIFTNQPADVVPSSSPDTEKMPKVVSSDNPFIIGAARIQAIDDAGQIRDLQEAGNFVVVNWIKVGKRASNLAGRDIRDYYQRSGQSTRDDYKVLLETYKTTYQTELRKELGDEQEGVSYLADAHEVHLRGTAIQDKQIFASYGNSLIRDLAVIRAFAEFGVDVDQAPEHLQNIHPYIEKYQSYYINPREEVLWPDQETFRS